MESPEHFWIWLPNKQKLTHNKTKIERPAKPAFCNPYAPLGIGRTDPSSFQGPLSIREWVGFLELCGVHKKTVGKLEKGGEGCIPDIAAGMRKHQIWSGTNR